MGKQDIWCPAMLKKVIASAKDHYLLADDFAFSGAIDS